MREVGGVRNLHREPIRIASHGAFGSSEAEAKGAIDGGVKREKKRVTLDIIAGLDVCDRQPTMRQQAHGPARVGCLTLGAVGVCGAGMDLIAVVG